MSELSVSSLSSSSSSPSSITILTTREEIEVFIRRYKTFLFDCDGVVYRGNTPIRGMPSAIAGLKRDYNARVFYVTNSSRLSRQGVAEKLCRLGFDATPEEVINSSYASATYLHQLGFDSKHTILVHGEEGLLEEIKKIGCQVISTQELVLGDYSEEVYAERDLHFVCSAVVVGYNAKTTMEHIALCTRALTEFPNALFLSTNADPTYPAGTHILPGAGSIRAAIITASGRQPDGTVGKPNPLMWEIIAKEFGLEASSSLMVGDRIDTDIFMARDAGIDGLVVFSGVTSKDDSEVLKSYPFTHAMHSFGDVAQLFEERQDDECSGHTSES